MRVCAGPIPLLNEIMAFQGRFRMEASPDPQTVIMPTIFYTLFGEVVLLNWAIFPR